MTTSARAVKNRPTLRLAKIAVVLSFASAFACSGSSGSRSADGVDVGPDGATFTTHGVIFTIPPGALTTNVTIIVTTDTLNPPGYTVDGLVYHFAPAGLHFTAPITVRLPGTAKPEKIYWTLDGSEDQFAPLTTTFDGDGASAAVTHFSTGFLGSFGTGVDVDAGAADVATQDAMLGDASEASDARTDGGVDAGGDDADAAGADSGVPDAGGITCTGLYRGTPMTETNVAASLESDGLGGVNMMVRSQLLAGVEAPNLYGVAKLVGGGYVYNQGNIQGDAVISGGTWRFKTVYDPPNSPVIIWTGTPMVTANNLSGGRYCTGPGVIDPPCTVTCTGTGPLAQ